MATRLGGWALPARLLGSSSIAAAVLLAPLGVGYALGGPPAAVGIMLGYLASLRAAMQLRPGQALGLAVPAALAAAVALGVRGEPVAAASFVALCCILIAPANVLSDGLMAAVPTVVVVLVAVVGAFDPASMIGWMLAGSAVVVLLGALVGRRSRPPGIEASRAWRYAIVMAVSVGLVTYLILRWQVPHGYWIALTMTVVLRPFGDETRKKALQRVLGTIGGVLLGLTLTGLLPVWALGVVILACLVLTVAYSRKGDYARQVAFMTPPVVMLGGTPESMAVERAITTVAGALVAAATAVGLTWWADKRPHDRGTDAGEHEG